MTGWIRAKIFASTSAVDTDFTALLADVEPSGYARFLTDGIVRARYRNSTAKAELVEPGKVYEYDIDLWATSNVFKAGHRIRLYVSSSNFPRFSRNLNTGEANRGRHPHGEGEADGLPRRAASLGAGAAGDSALSRTGPRPVPLG